MIITIYYHRREKLEQSLLYQQFLVGLDEEESWLNEKTTLISSDEVGDTLAAVQVSTKPLLPKLRYLSLVLVAELAEEARIV